MPLCTEAAHPDSALSVVFFFGGTKAPSKHLSSHLFHLWPGLNCPIRRSRPQKYENHHDCCGLMDMHPRSSLSNQVLLPTASQDWWKWQMKALLTCAYSQVYTTVFGLNFECIATWKLREIQCCGREGSDAAYTLTWTCKSTKGVSEEWSKLCVVVVINLEEISWLLVATCHRKATHYPMGGYRKPKLEKFFRPQHLFSMRLFTTYHSWTAPFNNQTHILGCSSD